MFMCHTRRRFLIAGGLRRSAFPGREELEWWSVRSQSRGSPKDHVDSHLTVYIYDGGVARGGGEGNEQVYMCCWQTQCNDSFLYLRLSQVYLIDVKIYFWKTLNEKEMLFSGSKCVS